MGSQVAVTMPDEQEDGDVCRLRQVGAGRDVLSKIITVDESTVSMSMNTHGVLDHVSQIRDTVLMSVYLEVRNLGGSGFWNKGLMSKGRERGSSVYKQSESEVDGSCHR
jgi:hypothetical protein